MSANAHAADISVPRREPRGAGRGLHGLHPLHSQMALRCWQLIVLVAFVGQWQLVVSLHLVDPIIAKSPGQVFAFLRQSSASGELWHNTLATMEAVCIAFGLASIVGVVIEITLGLLRGVERVLTPFFDAANAMPRIALAPVFIVWLGIGINAKVALAFSIVVFIVVSAAQAGVRSATRKCCGCPPCSALRSSNCSTRCCFRFLFRRSFPGCGSALSTRCWALSDPKSSPRKRAWGN